MNREKAKALLPVIQAYIDGRQMQASYEDGPWEDIAEPSFNFHIAQYRPKPEPKWRAWTHDECPQNFIVSNKVTPRTVRVAVKQSGYDHVRFFLEIGEVGQARISFDDLLLDWNRILEDGREVPCGVVVDE